MLTDKQQELVDNAIDACRREVDSELHAIKLRIDSHTITEEQAEDIAIRAAQKAKAMTKKELIDDAKMEIADAAIGVLRRSFQVISLFIIGLAFYVGSIKWPWK